MTARTNQYCLSIILILSAFFVTGAVMAEGKKYTVSQQTYKILEKSRKLMDQANYRSALNRLQDWLPKVAGNRYETALVHQHLAYVYLEQGNYGRGLIELENTLENAATLPAETVQNLRYNLAQSAAQTENYAKAEIALDHWFAQEKSPSADAWYLRGLVQYKRQQFIQTAGYLKRALNLAYHDNWALLLLSIYLDQKQYPNAAEILQQLVNS